MAWKLLDLPDPSVFDVVVASDLMAAQQERRAGARCRAVGRDRDEMIHWCLRIGRDDYHDLLTRNVDDQPRWQAFLRSAVWREASAETQSLCKIAVATGRHAHHRAMFGGRPHPNETPVGVATTKGAAT